MRALLAALAATALAACASVSEPAPRWSVVVHGGAGVIDRAQMSPELEAEYRLALSRALSDAAAALEANASALDAVEAAVRGLENDPLFNAGRGAVFTSEGRNELDASIMDGATREAGAVAGVTRTRNPITLARRVMEQSPHVMLIGEGAEAFARAQAIDEAPPSWFYTARRWRQLEERLTRDGLPLPQRPEGVSDEDQSAAIDDDHRFGTVGVIVRDSNGNIAAGTSTGGTTAKRWGRVGDTPVIGAGTYAQNGVCGVSATGTGEYFIRVGVAREICARMQLRGESAQSAADAVIGEVGALGGDGGVIVMDGNGRAAWSFNTRGMYRARLEAGGTPEIAIFADEEN